jgi:undecaprenyl diphosphate synthase
VKVEVWGRWRELLKPYARRCTERIIERTADYGDSGKVLTVLIGYNGNEERGAALQQVAGLSVPSDYAAANRLLRDHAWTGHLPDVDLVIRTGSLDDPHNSNGFLSLITDNSQYIYSDLLFPDFTKADLEACVAEFHRRERRLGR